MTQIQHHGEYQPSLFAEAARPSAVFVPAYDFEREANVFREVGGDFARDLLGVVTLEFGDGLSKRFRFIYNPNSFSVQRWGGPRVEIFGRFGYHDLRSKVSPPSKGERFEDWIRSILEQVKDGTAARFARNGGPVFTQSAERLGLTSKQTKKILQSDDTARTAVREKDTTPVELGEITFQPTEWRSHYEIPVHEVYYGSDVDSEPESMEVKDDK